MTLSARMLYRPAAAAALLGVLVLGVTADAASPPSYREEVMADNPAGYWRLGEASGTVVTDETANDTRGVYKNGVVLGAPGALATDPNTSANFDGGNDLADFADPPSGALDFGTDDFTAEAWIKTSTNNETSVMGKRVTAGPFWTVTVTDDSNHVGQLRANVRDTLNGTVTRQAYSTRRVDDGQWHHVVVRFDRDNAISFYIDAVSAGSGGGPMPADLSNTANFQIGKAQDHQYLRGQIDDVAVYRSLLPASRIGAHFNASTIDDTAPNVTLTSPAGGGSTTDTTPSFEGDAGGAVGDEATVNVDIHAGSDTNSTPVQSPVATRDGDGSFSVEASPALEPGTYTARARQTDRAGNLGQSTANTFTVQSGGGPVPASPTIVAAGDIAGCGGTTSGERLTTDLIEGLPNATVLPLGDLAYPNGTAEEYANCYGPNWGRFKNRTKPIPGGHDYSTPGASAYYAYFGAAAGDPSKGYYSFELGDWHVVALNVAVCAQVGCEAGDPQEAWLRADLAAHPAQCTLALMHEPRFSSGAVHGGTTDAIDLWEALYDHGAEVVLSGDDHLYERFHPQTPNGQLDTEHGISQFVVGTGGFYLYDFAGTKPNSAYRLNTTYGVLKATLHPDRFAFKFLRADGGSSTDAGSVPCHSDGSAPPPDRTAPETALESGPSGTTTSTSATFVASSPETGAIFQCRLDGASWLPCNMPMTYTALADGQHVFEVRARDAAGNIDATPESRTWTVDTTPPETTLDFGPSGTVTTTSASFEFSSNEPAATFECRRDTTSWSPCSSPQAYSGLTAGIHDFEVRAIDVAGHVDLTPASRTWTIDDSPAPDTTPPDTTIDSGPSGTEDVGSAQFTFSADEPGARFDCAVDGGGWNACTSPHDILGLADGDHDFRVRAIDAAGNADGSPATRSWTVELPPPPDTTPPDTSIVLGPSGTTTGPAASFTFSANEIGSSFECKLDSGDWATCSSPQAYALLLDGDHTFSVRATDPADNVDPTPATSTWSVDALPPETTVTSGPAAQTASSSVSLAFSASESGSSFECRIDGGAWTDCTSPAAYTNLADGAHDFEVRATDGYGNVDTNPARHTWSVDTAAPDTTITSGPTGSTASTTASIGFTASEGGTTFECRLNAGTWGSCTSPEGLTGLTDGAQAFEARAIDALGNADPTPATRSWIVDTVAPDTTITSGPPATTSSTSASLQFSASEPGATLECRLDAGAWAACTSPAAYASLTAGTYTFEVRAIDAAGTVDATPASRTWRVDTTAPETTITSGPSGLVASRSASIAFTSSETGGTFECRLDGGAWSSCSSPKTVSNLADGSHTLAVRAIDAAGNVDATPASRTWSVDATPPDTTITFGTSGNTTSTSASFWFTSTEEGTFQCRLDAGSWAVCTSPKVYSAVTKGVHTFYVRAVDSAGNRDPTPATQSWHRK
jgi:Concanavalin A-like lectin/glucanases superfamily/Bacterial Ig-like domain/Calcineurin-like phosphoesterase